jgi:hypothetical protein
MELAVEAHWSIGGFASLLECLRTNTVMERLDLLVYPPFSNIFPMEMVEDLLSTYNWTLRELRVSAHKYTSLPLEYDTLYPSYWLYAPLDPHQVQIDALLRVNDGVRRAMEQLEAQQYRVGRPSILPDAIERFRGRPTPVYRLLRRGNCGAFSEHLMREVVGDKKA